MDDEKRCPKGYTKQGRLGTGGFGVVWDAMSADGSTVALKQIVKGKGLHFFRSLLNMCPWCYLGNSSENNRAVRTAKTEIAIAQRLFPDEERQRTEEGSKYIARLFAAMETSYDVWMVFEKGGQTINKAMYKMKGDFVKVNQIHCLKLRMRMAVISMIIIIN